MAGGRFVGGMRSDDVPTVRRGANITNMSVYQKNNFFLLLLNYYYYYFFLNTKIFIRKYIMY